MLPIHSSWFERTKHQFYYPLERSRIRIKCKRRKNTAIGSILIQCFWFGTSTSSINIPCTSRPAQQWTQSNDNEWLFRNPFERTKIIWTVGAKLILNKRWKLRPSAGFSSLIPGLPAVPRKLDPGMFLMSRESQNTQCLTAINIDLCTCCEFLAMLFDAEGVPSSWKKAILTP